VFRRRWRVGVALVVFSVLCIVGFSTIAAGKEIIIGGKVIKEVGNSPVYLIVNHKTANLASLELITTSSGYIYFFVNDLLILPSRHSLNNRVPRGRIELLPLSAFGPGEYRFQVVVSATPIVSIYLPLDKTFVSADEVEWLKPQGYVSVAEAYFKPSKFIQPTILVVKPTRPSLPCYTPCFYWNPCAAAILWHFFWIMLWF
jgi:hypothetical protein